MTGTRYVTVQFNDHLDSGSLADPEEFGEWLRHRLQGLRDIQVTYIEVVDEPVVKPDRYEAGVRREFVGG
jgi:hypothetical protein